MILTFDKGDSVKTASALRDKMLKGIQEGDLVCDLANLERIDCSIAQLIISAMKEGKKRNVRVRLKGLRDDLKEQMENCGLRYSVK